MFAQFKSQGAALTLAALCALPLAAQAQDATSAPLDTQANQVVVRDASGALRAATAAEARALHATAGVRAVGIPMERLHASGARGARLTDAFMSHSLVTRLPDGRLVTQCVHSQDELEAALQAPATAKTLTAPTE